jgi:hypothetical protein
VEPPDGYFGAFVNGKWNGMVAMAIRMVRFALFVTEKYKENNCTQVLNGI